VIVFNPSGVGSGLDRVSAAGGVPLPLNLDVDGRWPWFLPDGQHFLYSANNSIRLGSLDSKQTKPLVESQSDAVYTQGHVLYLRDDTLMAQVFDLRRLTFGGEAVPIAENVKSIGAQRRGIFSASQNGTLAYQSRSPFASYQLTWLDRSGKRLGPLDEPGDIRTVDLSPDGRHACSPGVSSPTLKSQCGSQEEGSPRYRSPAFKQLWAS
jgi:eukaryotic-like serine/threonine-protein kinase